jgi:cyclopropane-fatty-acyl-phospholipid synthase
MSSFALAPLLRRSVSESAARPRKLTGTHTVVECYDFFDCVFPECGLHDLTDGIYKGDATTDYEQAQNNQVDWLLDQVGCRAGSRILDIGCGYGRLLARARDRGAEAIGITISPPQAANCRARGLDVRLVNYKDLPEHWTGCFDGIVANGSPEHFVMPSDVVQGRADEVYRELFQICSRVLNPHASRRFATTVIHQCEHTPRLTPEELLQGPLAFPMNSDKFHYALLQRTFGGYYPEIGQLDGAAASLFEKVQEVDGTHDYHLTSEEWFKRVREVLCSWRRGPKVWARLAKYLATRPSHCLTSFWCLLIAESWQRQFRGENPPTRLLRQVWQLR